MRHRPVIAVTGPRRGGIARFFIALCILLSGGIPKLFLENRDRKNKDFDGLIISGGDDLNHSFYENEFCDLEDIISWKRDALEYNLLHKAYSEDKPVFGICRGYQLINIYFGGRLHKDITLEYGRIKYSVLPWKRITLEKNTRFHTLFDLDHIKINTLHHQAVRHIPSRFAVTARDFDGMIQAIEHRYKPVFGVQWHPEYLFYMPKQLGIFRRLVRLAQTSAT